MEALQMLITMGDFLDSLDNVQELNGIGFSKADKGAWQNARGNQKAMVHVLKKYEKTQLVSQFPACSEVLAISTEPTIIPTWGQKGLQIVPDVLPSRLFGGFVNAVKAAGCWWEPQTKTWYIPYHKFGAFDTNALGRALKELGFQITPIPEAPEAALAKGEIVPGCDGVVHVSAEHGMYRIKFDYHQGLVELFKNSTGQLTGITEYDPETKTRLTNSLPLVEEIVTKIRDRFPTLQIKTYGITEAIKAAKERKEKMEAPIAVLQDKLAEGISLFGFQNEGVRFIDSTGGNVLLGYDMGLGKTAITLSWLASRGKSALIVCPKIVRSQWLAEAQRFYPGVFKTAEIKSGKRFDVAGANLVAINFDMVVKYKDELLALGLDCLVIDESHNVASMKASRTMACMELSKGFQHKILLSGTAIKNKRTELFTQVEMIRPGFFESPEELRGSTIGGTWHDIQEFYMMRTKTDVLKDLPPKITSVTAVEVKKCPDLYQGMEIGDFSRLRADVAVAKAPATVEFIEEILESSDSCVVVFSESVEASEIIAQALGDRCWHHRANDSDDTRQAMKDDFNLSLKKEWSGRRVFVTTRQSCKEGANLTRADKVVFNDLPWNPANLRQGEDRCIAAGQLVHTDAGLVPIEKVRIGDMVLTHLGRYKKVVGVFSRNAKKEEMVELKYYRYNKPLICTKDHKLLTQDGWIEAEKVSRSLCFPIPRVNKDIKKFRLRQTTFKQQASVAGESLGKHFLNGRYNRVSEIKITNKFLYILGWFLADGWVIKNKKGEARGVGFSDHSKLESKRKDDLISAGYDLRPYRSKSSHSVSFTLYSKDISKFILDNFGEKAHGKKIPQWIIDLPSKRLSHFFEGYISGDGYKRKKQVEWVTASSDLASKSMLIASKLGHIVSLRLVKGFYVCGFTLNGNPDNKKLLEKTKSLHFHPVMKISLCDATHLVHDLTVEEDHSFVVGNAVVHNCYRIGTVNAVNVYWMKAVGNQWDEKLVGIMQKKYALAKKVLEGKQVTAEEREWMEKEILMKEVMEGLK